MRTHNSINVILIMPDGIRETLCKPSLSISLMDYELSDPTHRFVIVSPAASKRITGKEAVNGDPHVRACSVIE